MVEATDIASLKMVCASGIDCSTLNLGSLCYVRASVREIFYLASLRAFSSRRVVERVVCKLEMERLSGRLGVVGRQRTLLTATF